MSERDLPEELPVFPLPNAVLFPGTTLPLYVFEPRYRQMVEDVLRHGRWIAVALLRPGYDADYEGTHWIATYIVDYLVSVHRERASTGTGSK